MKFREWVDRADRMLLSRIKAAGLPNFNESYGLSSVGMMHDANEYWASWRRESRRVNVDYHDLPIASPSILVGYMRPETREEMTSETPRILIRRPPDRNDRLLQLTPEDSEKMVGLVFGYLIEMNLPDEAPDGLM